MLGYLTLMGEVVMENGFESVYPFATENVSEYFTALNLKDQSVLTVGSSLDQLFNALVYGAKKVSVFDINPYVKEYFEIKKQILLHSKRKNFVKKVFELQKQNFAFSKDVPNEKRIYESNIYLSTDAYYEKLQELVQTVPIDFIEGNIFTPDLLESYDRIIFSNILQYLDYFFPDKNVDLFQQIKILVTCWNKFLNKNGILQLLYLYSYGYQDLFKENHSICCYNLKKIVETLQPFKLDIEWISGFYEKKDAIVTYTKKI